MADSRIEFTPELGDGVIVWHFVDQETNKVKRERDQQGQRSLLADAPGIIVEYLDPAVPEDRRYACYTHLKLHTERLIVSAVARLLTTGEPVHACQHIRILRASKIRQYKTRLPDPLSHDEVLDLAATVLAVSTRLFTAAPDLPEEAQAITAIAQRLAGSVEQIHKLAIARRP